MPRRFAFILLALLLTALPAAAQFYTTGNEPAALRWKQIKTQDYKVVYPEGLDSLARVYAATLERVKVPVGATAGYTPNQNYRRRLPVILHPWTAYANGMVTWTPKRMELYTTPDYAAPLPTPWEDHLIIHESRHVSQMQYVNEKPYKVGSFLIGQLFAGALAGIYCGPAFFEGDAVVAETELTPSGRGRNSAFLEYYRVAFRDGDTRDWWQWRYGSLDKFTPDYYTIGYVTAAGMRSVYDAPDFTARYYQRIFAHRLWPFPFFNYQKTVKDVTGKKFRPAFREICDTLQVRWNRDEAARAPFMPSRRVTPEQRHYVDYSGMCFLNGTMYGKRTGQAQAAQLVGVPLDGSEPGELSPFAGGTSKLRADEALGRIYWSEIVSDRRWEMISYSEIWYADSTARKHCLKRRTRWYNPSVSPDGSRLAVTEYPFDGGSALLVIDACSGEELERYDAPAGMQVVESEWAGGRLYACAVTIDGQGIYDVCDGYRRVLACGNNVVKELFAHDGALCFTSDLSGVDELYAFYPAAGQAYRLSSSAQGASSFVFSPDGGTLYYSKLSTNGRFICATPSYAMLNPVPADFGVQHRYEFAEELTDGGPGIVDHSPVELPEPVRYSRFVNVFRFHSWAPVYIDYEAVSDLSFDSVTSAAGLGAIAFFQNELNTLQGSVGYNAAYGEPKWTHKGEVKLTYTGLYPVFEVGFTVDNNPPSWYFLQHTFTDFKKMLVLSREELSGLPSVGASVLMYVPMTFSSGGWYRGVIPQLRWSLSNSIITQGHSAIMNRVSASLRGYAVKGTPALCQYPKLGLGLEAGWSGRPGATGIFNSNAYFYAYGYLPGLMDTHGLRLSTTLQAPVGDAPFYERYASVLPRGFGDYDNIAAQVSKTPFQARVTADYVFPFLSLDWSGLGPVAYVRNLEAKIHGDYSFAAAVKKNPAMHMGGVGADLCVVLGNLLWIPADTRLGVQYYYNFGAPAGASPHFVDLVFNVDL